MAGGRPPKYETAEALEAAIEEYFNPAAVNIHKAYGNTIKTQGEKEPRTNPTITGLALYLGFESRQSFYDYEKDGEFSYTIKRARLRIESAYEEKLHENGCTGAIFALKNFGWVDKTEVDNNTNLTINWPEERTYEADSQTDQSDRGAGG